MIQGFVDSLNHDEVRALAVRNYIGCEIVHNDCNPGVQNDLDNLVSSHATNCSRMEDDELRSVIAGKNPDVVLGNLNTVLRCYQAYQAACRKIGFNG